MCADIILLAFSALSWLLWPASPSPISTASSKTLTPLYAQLYADVRMAADSAKNGQLRAAFEKLRESSVLGSIGYSLLERPHQLPGVGSITRGKIQKLTQDEDDWSYAKGDQIFFKDFWFVEESKQPPIKLWAEPLDSVDKLKPLRWASFRSFFYVHLWVLQTIAQRIEGHTVHLSHYVRDPKGHDEISQQHLAMIDGLNEWVLRSRMSDADRYAFMFELLGVNNIPRYLDLPSRYPVAWHYRGR